MAAPPQYPSCSASVTCWWSIVYPELTKTKTIDKVRNNVLGKLKARKLFPQIRLVTSAAGGQQRAHRPGQDLPRRQCQGRRVRPGGQV